MVFALVAACGGRHRAHRPGQHHGLAGPYDVELTDLQANCTADDNPRSVSVTADQTTTAAFAVVCQAALYDRILFVSTRDGKAEIYVMNADGTGQTRFTTDPAGDQYPLWSPDGQKIVFQTFRDSDWDNYLLDADGGNVMNLTMDPAADHFGVWAPSR